MRHHKRTGQQNSNDINKFNRSNKPYLTRLPNMNKMNPTHGLGPLHHRETTSVGHLRLELEGQHARREVVVGGPEDWWGPRERGAAVADPQAHQLERRVVLRRRECGYC